MEFGTLLDPTKRQHDFYGSNLHNGKSAQNPSILGFNDLASQSSEDGEHSNRQCSCKSIAVFVYRYSIFITIGLQGMQLFAAMQPWRHFEIEVKDGFLVSLDPLLLFILVTCSMFQGMMLFSNLSIVMMRAADRTLSVSEVIGQYMTNTIGFGSLYLLIFLLASKENTFVFAPNTDVDLNNGFHHVYMLCLYFSVSTTTGAAVGEVAPSNLGYATTGCVMLQVLIGVVYHVAIFAFAVSHFQEQGTSSGATLAAHDEERMFRGEDDDDGNCLSNFLAWIGKFMCSPRLLRITETRLFVPTLFFLQAILLFALTAMDINATDGTGGVISKHGDSAPAPIRTATVMALWFFIAIVGLILVASYNLIYHVREHHIVTAEFLVQCYLSTAIAFANLYFFLYLYNENNFLPFHLGVDGARHKLEYRKVYWHSIYFSLTTFTGSNFGDLYPTSLTARLVTAVQLLVMVGYQAVVLSEGTAILVSKYRVKKIAKIQRRLSRRSLIHRQSRELL